MTKITDWKTQGTSDAQVVGGIRELFGLPDRGPRALHEIAREIIASWSPMYFGAQPYARAMLSLTDIHENYGADTAKSVVLYFLSNANVWRGETARRIKAELRAMGLGKRAPLYSVYSRDGEIVAERNVITLNRSEYREITSHG